MFWRCPITTMGAKDLSWAILAIQAWLMRSRGERERPWKYPRARRGVRFLLADVFARALLDLLNNDHVRVDVTERQVRHLVKQGEENLVQPFSPAG
jgi:hypothetical protein